MTDTDESMQEEQTHAMREILRRGIHPRKSMYYSLLRRLYYSEPCDASSLAKRFMGTHYDLIIIDDPYAEAADD